MKKSLLILLVAVFIFSVTAVCFGCNEEKENVVTEEREMYAKTQGYSQTLYVLDSEDFTKQQLETAVSLQGIVAQTESAIYIQTPDDYWLSDIKEKYEIRTIQVANIWELIDQFGNYIKDSKYVLYQSTADEGASFTGQSINYATVVAAVDNYVLISESLQNEAIAHGLTLGKDVTSESTRSIFETYKDSLSKKQLVHQNPNKWELRDYSIATKSMCFYGDYYDGDSEIRQEILSWADKNTPILGWTENEVNYVSSNSLFGKVTLAADWSRNLSLTAAMSTKDEYAPTNTEKRNVTADPSKHYLAIMMSDGDNLQWMQNGFATDAKYFGSKARGSFPMSWTITPSMYNLTPNILDYLYEKGTANDCFVAGPSGVGYINPAEYNADCIDEYAKITNTYMKKTGLSVINTIDNSFREDAYDSFAKLDNIKGGVCSVGNMYIEGAGGVVWSNDKPFVSMRETLWRIDGVNDTNEYYGFIERVAQRINSYKTDPTSIEGYTVLVAHAWSVGSMEYIKRFVTMLDENVELVTVDELIDLVTENVPHKNVLTLDDISPKDITDLAPIQSEQFIGSDLSGIKTEPERTFKFDQTKNNNNWSLGCGGLQYDSATHISAGIQLDGSDLNDVLDPLPNSWMVGKFELGDSDKYMTLFANSSSDKNANFRVRVLQIENNKIKSKTLGSQSYEKQQDSQGWYVLDSNSPYRFVYDLTEFVGKTVYISIEQDDTGDGDGETILISRIYITADKNNVASTFPVWKKTEILFDWNRQGNVVVHTEGVCLEAAQKPASISKTFTVTENTKYLKIYVRMFIRSGKKDVEPKLGLYVDDTLTRMIGQNTDYVSVDTDEYRCLIYDLSAYVGQTITVKFVSEAGEHAAIGAMTLEGHYSEVELGALIKEL